MNVNRKKIIFDRGTVVILVVESMTPEELVSFDPNKGKLPQAYLLIGPNEENLARIDGIELSILSNLITLLGPNSYIPGSNPFLRG